MRRIISVLTIVCLSLTLCIGGLPVSAQQINNDKNLEDPFATPRAKTKEFFDKLPESLKRGASPEAKAAWDKLTPQEREKVKAKVDKIFEEAKAKAVKEKEARRAQKRERKTWRDVIKGKSNDTGSDITLLFSDKQGTRKLIKAKESEAVIGTQREACDYCDPDPCFGCYPYNQPPQVDISPSPSFGTAPLAVNFTANAYDPDGYITSYYWNFGDGQTANGASVSHTYQTAGNFNATVTVTDDYGDSASASVIISASSGTQPPQGESADGDILPDAFENTLADAFTPVYHVSAYEPDNFATFGNFVPQTVQQRLGPNPISHFRVTPLGIGYNRSNPSQLLSVIRIDYLTLWDRDSGLVTGGDCDAFPGLTSLEGIGPHELDNERSVVLVAAPVPGNDPYNVQSFNLNPYAYGAYSYYTAAHENTFFDKSRYVDFPTNPIPAGWHINLALALSKHATYTFNPDYLPLVPDYVIYSAYGIAVAACYETWFNDFGIGDIVCLAALYYLYGAFFECGVERFINQGGSFAQTRINIGEPNRPINGAGFIQDDSPRAFRLYSKLINPVFYSE